MIELSCQANHLRVTIEDALLVALKRDDPCRAIDHHHSERPRNKQQTEGIRDRKPDCSQPPSDEHEPNQSEEPWSLVWASHCIHVASLMELLGTRSERHCAADSIEEPKRNRRRDDPRQEQIAKRNNDPTQPPADEDVPQRADDERWCVIRSDNRHLRRPVKRLHTPHLFRCSDQSARHMIAQGGHA